MDKGTIHHSLIAHSIHAPDRRWWQDLTGIESHAIEQVHLRIFALLAAAPPCKFEPTRRHANSSYASHAYELYDAYFEAILLPKFGMNQRPFDHIALLLISRGRDAFSSSCRVQVWSSLSMLIVVAYRLSILQSLALANCGGVGQFWICNCAHSNLRI